MYIVSQSKQGKKNFQSAAQVHIKKYSLVNGLVEHEASTSHSDTCVRVLVESESKRRQAKRCRKCTDKQIHSEADRQSSKLHYKCMN